MKASGTAVVTGASRGIGRAVALELARRGFDVVATMRDPAAGESLSAEAAASGAHLRTATLDVRRPETFEMPTGLRVLVNNAAIEVAYLPVEHASLADWREIFETNVFGLVAVTREAIPQLRASGGGVICNITSSSILFPMPFYAAYRASKAAVSALGESLRAELAAAGIRILEIMPGATDTDMLAGSDGLPEGVVYEAYRELAERAREGRKQAVAMTSPVEATATRIVDAVVDDGSPMRCASDEIGASMLDSWRKQGDEEWLRGMLEGFMASTKPAT